MKTHRYFFALILLSSLASQLQPEIVDYLVRENAVNHHTDEFDESVYGLVVRRGQEFQLRITFDRAFNEDKDQLIIQLAFGKDCRQVSHVIFIKFFFFDNKGF